MPRSHESVDFTCVPWKLFPAQVTWPGGPLGQLWLHPLHPCLLPCHLHPQQKPERRDDDVHVNFHHCQWSIHHCLFFIIDQNIFLSGFMALGTVMRAIVLQSPGASIPVTIKLHIFLFVFVYRSLFILNLILDHIWNSFSLSPIQKNNPFPFSFSLSPVTSARYWTAFPMLWWVPPRFHFQKTHAKIK